MRYAIIDKETGEIIDDVVFVGRSPHRIDKGFVKFFVAFLDDIVRNDKLIGKAARLLFYMASKMNYETLETYIIPDEVAEDLQITKRTLYAWIKCLLEVGLIEKVATNVYRLQPYTFVKGNMSRSVENELHKAEKKKKSKSRRSKHDSA